MLDEGAANPLFERLLLDENPDATLVVRTSGEVVHWNHGAESIFGFASAEAVGQLLEKLIIPEDRRAEHRALLVETQQSGRATCESLRSRKDGSLIYVDISWKAIQSAHGVVEYLLLTAKDVTDLRVSRDAKIVEAKFRDLLESMPDAIVVVNQAGRIVLANRQLETVFGYAPGELRGKPVEALLPHGSRSAHVGHRARYMMQPRTRSMGANLELRGLRRDGTDFPVEISLSPLQTDEGTLVMSAVRDISERKQIQRALSDKNAELQAAASAKNRFLASMSHELRTPLNAIIGFTGTMLMRLPGPLTADQDRQLRTIQSSARHLLSLINDLLDVAKIESGKLDLKLEPVACAAVLEEVATSLRPLAEKKGLQFKTWLPASEVMLTTDRRALSQIIINLANNAIKYTDTGHVVLGVGKRQDGANHVTEFIVGDTGRGIRPEDQVKLFQAFTQFDAESARRHDSSGLGLHVSQKLAVLLGAKITCVSDFGKGSTFTLSFVE
jgi:PAS domain S-box-containing protein